MTAMTIRSWAKSVAMTVAAALSLLGCGSTSDSGVDSRAADTSQLDTGPAADTMPDAVGCGGGKSIHYTSPGCGAAAVPLCDAPTFDACLAIVWYCSCDGMTSVVGGCGTSNVPFLHAGPCKADAGLSTVDATTVD
jgi:hypothetical protein